MEEEFYRHNKRMPFRETSFNNDGLKFQETEQDIFFSNITTLAIRQSEDGGISNAYVQAFSMIYSDLPLNMSGNLFLNKAILSTVYNGSFSFGIDSTVSNAGQTLSGWSGGGNFVDAYFHTRAIGKDVEIPTLISEIREKKLKKIRITGDAESIKSGTLRISKIINGKIIEEKFNLQSFLSPEQTNLEVVDIPVNVELKMISISLENKFFSDNANGREYKATLFMENIKN